MNVKKKKALITGITGQIGSYLAELLLEKGYEVYGLVRTTFNSFDKSYKEINKEIKTVNGNLEDLDSIERAINKVEPNEIYNLASQTDTQISFNIPEHTLKVNGFSLIRICETVKKINKPIKVFQAGSAEFYGHLENQKVDENTPFNPVNSYAIAKLAAFYMIKNYRETHKMFCCNGIVFNTESPRRGENFVTRKITLGVADIVKGKKDKLRLGNLNAKRDWIHAKDTANAIWRIMQADKPDDYVIASGESHSIREFVELAFKEAGIEIAWKGEGINEIGFDKKTGREYVEINSKYFRSKDRNIVGDSSKLINELEWRREHLFEDIVKEMINYDLKR